MKFIIEYSAKELSQWYRSKNYPSIYNKIEIDNISTIKIDKFNNVVYRVVNLENGEKVFLKI